MKGFTITDNACEKKYASWDEERLAITHQLKMPDDASSKTIILNPLEAFSLQAFINEVMAKTVPMIATQRG